MKNILRFLSKALLALILFVAILLMTFGLFFFSAKSIKIDSYLAASLIERFAPEDVKIGFKSFSLQLDRPPGLFFAKQVTLKTEHLCVQYEKTAVQSCFADVRLSLRGGFGGDLLKGQSRLLPHIMRIDPVFMSGGVVHVDLTAFPASKPDQPKSRFDLLGFLRKEIFPKWDLEGSRVEVKDFLIKTAPDSSFAAKFDLQPGDITDHTIEAVLHEVREIAGPLRASAKITVTRPADWGGRPNVDPKAKDAATAAPLQAWKIFLTGDVAVDEGRAFKIEADANVRDLENLDFRIRTLLHGISAIREARLEGKMKQDEFKGVASVKGGSDTSELQALDFMNCAISADLNKKEAGVQCGPQSVHLQLRKRGFLKRPDLFTLAPEIDFKVTNASFGEKKSADFSLEIILDHLGIFRLGTSLKGHAETSAKAGLRYQAKGRVDVVVPMFAQIKEMLSRTPYAIPAPFNSLDGAIGAQANVDLTQDGGVIDYQAATRLDSDYQSMHLDMTGKTTLTKLAAGGPTAEAERSDATASGGATAGGGGAGATAGGGTASARAGAGGKRGGGFFPSTDITVSILQLSLSAPRVDLRAPPAFKPDGRFVSLDKKSVQDRLDKKAKPATGRFKLHVRTVSPEAIHIATNLTKTSIPISIDAVYDDHVQSKSPVTGTVEVGETTIELFKRNAQVHSIRVDFLESGDNRLNGNIGVNYGDYAISILLLGQVADPQVRFVSDPPLDDNQIVSVLLFGRPQHELGDDERNSVANTKAAMADAVLGLGSLYLLASTPIESVGYDPDTGRVVARVGLGGGASVELGAGNQESGSGVGFRKRLSKDFIFRSDVETLGSTGQRTVSALIEWVKRF